MVAEAAWLASAGAVAGSIRKAGFSMVTAWGGSGAIGSMGFRAIGDIHRGEFSGINAYVIDGLTGAVVGIAVGGTFHLASKAPGLSRLRDWYQAGAENDPAWAKLSAKDKWLYEIGQKTLPSGQWEPLAGLSPVERGRAIVGDQGWFRASLPRSAKFMVPGEAGTLSTGPTPMFRQWMPRFLGMTSGAVGRHGFLPEWEESSLGPPPNLGQSFGLGAQGSLFPPLEDPVMGLLPEEGGLIYGEGWAAPEGGAVVVPPGWDTIIVVPEGREMEYLMKMGKVGDFPAPSLPEGDQYA
jgi:hypothetical protein